MSRYRTRVSNRRVAVALALTVLAGASLVGLSHWLLPPALVSQPLPAPAPADPATPAPTPGAVTCPTLGDRGGPSTVLRPTASELIDCPDLYDGRTIAYRGEAIGAIFPLGDRAVVILNDDDYALGPGPLPEARTALGGNSGIAVILPPDTADTIEHLGGYRQRGDRVDVIGDYASASDLLGGEPAIVAHQATVARPGYAIPHGVDTRTVIAAVFTVLAATTVAVAELRDRR